MQRRAFRWDDVEQLADLGTACWDADRCGAPMSAESLRTSLAVPGRDPEKTSIVVEEASGKIIANSSAWPTPGVESDTIRIGVQIHPAHRTREAYTELLRDAEARGRVAYVPSGRPAELHVGCHERPALWREVVESAGYAATRWFIEMECRLDRYWPDVEIPAGIDFRTVSDGIDPLPLKHALDEAFLDHWNPVEFTDEHFLHYARSPQFRAGLTIVAFDSEGTVAGGLVGGIRDNQHAASDEVEGRVEVLGVRREYRNRGIGRALLTTAFRLMKSAGITIVSLDVDADNPTGATGLYASVGFAEKERITVYSKGVTEAV